MNAPCTCARCEGERLRANNADWWEFSRMYVCADCGDKRCPRATWHGYQCNNSNEPGQEARPVEPPKRECERRTGKRVATWLLRVADRAESLAYWFDDRAWARPAFGVVQATLDTEPLSARIERLEQRPPAPLPYDPDGYDVYGTHWRDKS